MKPIINHNKNNLGGSFVPVPSLHSGRQAQVGLSVTSPSWFKRVQPLFKMSAGLDCKRDLSVAGAFHYYPFRRLPSIILFIAVVFLTSNAKAQVVSLDSVLSIIRKENPMLQSYRSKANAMNTYAGAARSQMAPEIGGGLWMVPYKKVMDERDKGQIMLSVQQKFTNSVKLRANEKYLNSKAAIEEANEGYVFNELRAQAKEAYYDLVILEKKKKALAQSEDIINLILKIGQLRYPYNQSKLSTIYKAEGKLHEIRNMQLMNENEIHHRKTLLAQLMNHKGHTNLSVDTLTKPKPIFIEADTSILAANRSDIRKLDKSIQSMRLNQALENSQSKPDFNISFNHMIPRSSIMPSQFMLLGMISIPIAPWSSKMYKANVKGMDYEIESMKTERVAVLNELQAMTNNMASEITSLQKQLENYEKRIVPALKKNHETIMLAYEENREELPIVIDSWETLNMTQLQYLDTLQKYYQTIVSYEKQIEK
jgi:cobalt-zinc-cadmium efflux system outer membrane protein